MDEMNLFNQDIKGSTFAEICNSLKCNGNEAGWPDKFGKAVREYINEKNINKIRTLSLFSGAGGLDIGFSDVGFDIVESVEIESKFCETLELNTGIGKQFPHTHVTCIDIREFSSEHLGKIDFIIGGPPCQTFSAAGRRANGVLGTTDSRGVLFREYVRLLKELQPKGFLFENVYGIIGAQQGKPWKEILDSFSEVGYHLFYRILDAADYGVPQHRERLIIVGLKEGSFKFPRPTHGPDSIDRQPFYNAGNAVSGLQLTDEEAKCGIGGRYGKLLDDIPPGLNYSFYTEKMGHPHPIFAWRSKFSDFLYKADPNEPVRTIKASGGAYTGPFHWNNRFFANAEYKRLQTFPDDYQISGSKQVSVKQIGNSVPPQLARILAIAIRQQIFITDFPFSLSLLNDSEELGFRKRKRALSKIYQQKTNEALRNNSEPNIKIHPKSHKYYCSMNPEFEFKECTKDVAEYNVDVIWNDNLDINIYDVGQGGINKKNIVIDIELNDALTNVNIKKCKITVYSSKYWGFTIGWKAFEQELIKNHLKADLIQLNGYYQYKPKICSKVEFISDFPRANILQSIVGGKLVTEIVPTSQLAQEWDVEESEIYDIAEWLRDLGYEIRNHNTNPQIAEGDWLIPYAFPTLTKLSVQLRKKLR